MSLRTAYRKVCREFLGGGVAKLTTNLLAVFAIPFILPQAHLNSSEGGVVVVELDVPATFPSGGRGVLYCTRTVQYVSFADKLA